MNQILWYSISCQESMRGGNISRSFFFGRAGLTPFTRPYIGRIENAVYK